MEGIYENNEEKVSLATGVFVIIITALVTVPLGGFAVGCISF